MPTVYNLQHETYRDRETGVEFHPMAQPRVVREETDEIGRVTRYIAHSSAEVGEENLDYFLNRPHMFHVEGDRDPVEDEAPAEFTVRERENAGWFDVLGPDGETENDKALREEDARELADHLNETVG